MNITNYEYMEFVHDFINTFGELMNEHVGHIA